jgi:hypothetical protein
MANLVEGAKLRRSNGFDFLQVQLVKEVVVVIKFYLLLLGCDSSDVVMWSLPMLEIHCPCYLLVLTKMSIPRHSDAGWETR